MKPIIIESPTFCSLISWFFEVGGITLFPFIIVENKDNPVMISHESIHIAQYSELYFIGFFFIYFKDWFIGLIKYRSFVKAYEQIRLEQEAYNNQYDLNWYLKRPKNNWKNYKV